MRKYLAAASLAAALVLVVSAASGAPGAKGALDGKTFVAESGEKGKPAGLENETIHFANGKFHSVACDAYGFGDGAYTATAAPDGSVRWTAETSSPKEGKISWKGTVTGDKIDGTYVWTKTGQAPIEYWLKGTAKK